MKLSLTELLSKVTYLGTFASNFDRLTDKNNIAVFSDSKKKKKRNIALKRDREKNVSSNWNL